MSQYDKRSIKLYKNMINHKYLGVTLDRTMIFQEHIRKTIAIHKTSLNIVQKPCKQMYSVLTWTHFVFIR